jgi:hypothetical protein
MKKRLSTFLFTALIATNLFSQSTTTVDSVSMTPGTRVDVFYNLQTGKKDTVANNNWHLAFAARNAQPPTKTMQAATVLINEGRGVSIYESNQTFNNWTSFDTTGWKTWATSFNSDANWDEGALNKNRDTLNSFDYGWGKYNMTTRDVSGNKIFLIAIDNALNPFGAPSNFRKLSIQKVVYDSMWLFTISRLDGTDSNTVTILKKNFQGKLFAYYNLITNQVIDREPIPASQWNLLFTRFKSLVTLGPNTIMYPVMGVLQNNNTMGYRVTGANANAASYDTLKFNSKIRTIDWDWKEITTTPGAWPIKDTMVFFTKVANRINKIKFTEYFDNRSNRQVIVFNKTSYDALSTNNVFTKNNNITVYPNPTSGKVNVSYTLTNNQPMTIEVTNSIGAIVANKTVTGGFGVAELNLSDVTSGVYFVRLTNNGETTVKKLVVNN